MSESESEIARRRLRVYQDPAAVLEQVRDIVRPLAATEPWIIQAPDGPRECWVDEHNQEHWIIPATRHAGGIPIGWRQLHIDVDGEPG